MAVKLRMKRLGNTHRPFYRIVSVDERLKRDGRVIEELGTFNPLEKNEAAQVDLNLDRAAYWLSVGAQPSETVASLLKKKGLNPTPGTRAEAQETHLLGRKFVQGHELQARGGGRQPGQCGWGGFGAGGGFGFQYRPGPGRRVDGRFGLELCTNRLRRRRHRRCQRQSER